LKGVFFLHNDILLLNVLLEWLGQWGENACILERVRELPRLQP